MIDYRISWDQGTGNFVILASGVTLTTYTTSVILTPNQVYKFKIMSRNYFGYSTTFSNEVLVRAASIPDSPTNLANNSLITASGIIGLTWSPGTSNGGSPLIDYRISAKTGANAYTVLASGISTTSYTASSLTAGAVYTFIIEARSLVGYSTTSSEFSIRAAARPSTPTSPVTSVVSNTGVTITWSAPFNGGSPITSYTIKIR